MVIRSTVGLPTNGARLGWPLRSASHHLFSSIVSKVLNPAIRASLVSPYRVPEYVVLGSVGLVIAVVGAVSARRSPISWLGAVPVGGFRPRAPRWASVTWYRHPPVMVTVTLVGVAVTAAWTVFSLLTSQRGFVDLSVYRIGVLTWWQRGDIYGVLPPTGIGVSLPFTYPPFAVVALGPLAILGWEWTIVCLTILSLVCLAVVIYLTVRSAWPNGGIRGAVVGTAVMLPLSLFTEPVRDTIWFGQVNLLLMALVALDCLVVTPRWPRGLLIGIAAAIKLTPAVFLLFFLLRKDYRAAVTMAVSGVVATAIGFLADWSGSFTFWFGSSGGAHAVGDSAALLNQSLAGGIARIGLSSQAETVIWVVVVAALAVFATAGVRKALRTGSVPLAMAITAGFGLIASPISWGHHWVYIVPVIIVMVADGIQRRQRGWLLAAAAAVAVYHAAAFLRLDIAGEWPPVRLLEENSFVLAAITLLVGYSATAVWRRVAAGVIALRRVVALALVAWPSVGLRSVGRSAGWRSRSVASSSRGGVVEPVPSTSDN
ncbi:MAG TPA: glycosyltransferase 87 family protein [Pseudonocardiaceae bacterium]|nr:glycosyltransferase 87 family protein [Pseudonocardiaceae bacterium]